MLVAEAWLGRMHRPEAAIGELRQVVDDPKADGLTARLAERELVDALVASGRIDEAVAEARSHATRLDPRFVREVGGSRCDAPCDAIARVVLAVVRLARGRGVSCVPAMRGTLGAACARAAKLAPVAAVFVAFIAIAGGVLASQVRIGQRRAVPRARRGRALPLLLLARAWSAVGSQSARGAGWRVRFCARPRWSRRRSCCSRR